MEANQTKACPPSGFPGVQAQRISLVSLRKVIGLGEAHSLCGKLRSTGGGDEVLVTFSKGSRMSPPSGHQCWSLAMAEP